MTGKDAGTGAPRWKLWKTRFSLIAAALAVLVVCFAIRQFWGPDPANAQTRQTRPRAQRSNTAARSRNQAQRQQAATGSSRPTRQARTTQTRQASDETKLMAVVNGQQILNQQLADECMRRYGNEVLESIVNKHLIWQECQRLRINITEDDVNKEVERMAAKFGLAVDRWMMMLEQERDISADKYRRDIVWPTLALRKLASGQIEVTQEQLRDAFESEYGPKVKVRMISVRDQKKAQQIWQYAQANPDKFGDIAKEHSEDANSAAARGLIPPIRKHVGHDAVENAAFALKEGEVSPVVFAANQYLIFKCEAHIPENYISSQNISQIKTQLHDQIRDQKLKVAAAELFKRLQEQGEVVNVFDDPQKRQQMPGVAAIINGRQISIQQLADESLLRHGKEVLEGEVNRLILSQELARQGKAVRDADIDREIARAADSYNYVKPDGSPDVQAWLKSVTEIDNVTVELYVRDAVWPSVALKLLVEQGVTVSSEDLEKGFAANYGERVEVLAIVVGSQRLANKVWEMARGKPTDEFFGELATQYSIEPVSKANLGKIPPIRMHGGQPLIEKEAFRLKTEELSGIIGVGDKFVILRCQGRTEPMVQDFNAVKVELSKDIREKKLRVAMAAEFDRLREGAQIDNFLANTTQVSTPRTASAAPRRQAVAPTSARGGKRR